MSWKCLVNVYIQELSVDRPSLVCRQENREHHLCHPLLRLSFVPTVPDALSVVTRTDSITYVIRYFGCPSSPLFLMPSLVCRHGNRQHHLCHPLLRLSFIPTIPDALSVVTRTDSITYVIRYFGCPSSPLFLMSSLVCRHENRQHHLCHPLRRLSFFPTVPDAFYYDSISYVIRYFGCPSSPSFLMPFIMPSIVSLCCAVVELVVECRPRVQSTTVVLPLLLR